MILGERMAIAALVWLAACGAKTGLESPSPEGEGGAGTGGSAGTGAIGAGAGPECDRCYLRDAVTDCGGVKVEITPYVTGGTFGGFQSTEGNSFQQTITVFTSSPAKAFGVTVLDPDYPENHVLAFDAQGGVLGDVKVEGDGAPGQLTAASVFVEAAGISTALLVPDPADYVAYDDAWVCFD